MVKWNSPNMLIAVLTIVGVLGIFFFILGKGLGGNEAVFAILGYVSGWASAIILFFFRKKPVEPPTETKK